MAADVARRLEAVWRIESAALIAHLTRLVGDLGVAEDLAQDALLAALEQWPRDGVPEKPGAWLTAVGKRRAIDHLRKRSVHERKEGEIAREFEAIQMINIADPDALVDEPIGDELLRLIFTCCHPGMRGWRSRFVYWAG